MGVVRVVLTEAHLGHASEPTLRDVSEALIAVYGTDYERHPVAARVLRTTMAQVMLRRPDERTKALGGQAQVGLAEALNTWFGPPTGA
jgi:hypothetical protein